MLLIGDPTPTTIGRTRSIVVEPDSGLVAARIVVRASITTRGIRACVTTKEGGMAQKFLNCAYLEPRPQS